MREMLQFYINGEWVDPHSPAPLAVINPATEEVCGHISMGGESDVEAAVSAACAAAPDFAGSTREQRLDLLQAITEKLDERNHEIAEAIMEEMGAPWPFAERVQAPCGVQHFKTAGKALRDFEFERAERSTLIVREAIGPAALITPWNWPMNQVAVKVAPALAAGCSMVLKPSEIAPFDAMILAGIMHEVGVPPGVFNLVNGDGPTVGAALARHPGIAMVSFTGSTRAGISVAQNAAPGVKRVAQELGGKSANIILDDADLKQAVGRGASACFSNSGQSCNAPTRMLVPRKLLSEATEIAADRAASTLPGDPQNENTRIGPVVSAAQWQKIQDLITAGIEAGATLAAGGTGRPDGLDKGYYVRPTVFSGVSNEMTIAREEIFGPVLCIIPYDDDDDAIRIANDSPYGLSGYVSSNDLERARKIAARMRTGMVHINGAPPAAMAPFGGYKQSGNGREWGPHGIDEFLEIKSVYGFEARQEK